MKKLARLLCWLTLTALLAPWALAEDVPACPADSGAATAATEAENALDATAATAVAAVTCVPTEEHEVSCFDGLDNDCDGLTDQDDFDCQIVCVESHCCGLLDCCPQGATCTTNAECCSNRCRGGAGKKKCI